MKAFKISTTIICILLFFQLHLSAEKISCRKYSGTYKEYTLAVFFSKIGKMLISVDSKNGRGYYSVPGNYTVKESKIDFIYKGLIRTFYIEKETMKASPYSFAIDEDFENKIFLSEDKAYSSSCR